MSSPAITGQGTLFKIASGSGSAKTITAVAVGNPTILTSAAHGMSLGDYGAFDTNFAGADAADLNGKSFVVIFKTTNTFAVAYDTTGHTITTGSTPHFTPQTYTTINGVVSIGDIESGSASEIDVTDLNSTAKEFLLGLVDNGSLSLGGNHAWSDAGQAILQARRNDGASSSMKVILPSGTTPTGTFAALVKKFSKSVAVDNSVKFTADIRVNGSITWS